MATGFFLDARGVVSLPRFGRVEKDGIYSTKGGEYELHPLLWRHETFGLTPQLFVSNWADVAQRRGNGNKGHITQGSLKSVCEYSKTSECVLSGEVAK